MYQAKIHFLYRNGTICAKKSQLLQFWNIFFKMLQRPNFRGNPSQKGVVIE